MKLTKLKITTILAFVMALIIISESDISADNSYSFYGDRIAQAIPSDSGAYFYSWLKGLQG